MTLTKERLDEIEQAPGRTTLHEVRTLVAAYRERDALRDALEYALSVGEFSAGALNELRAALATKEEG